MPAKKETKLNKFYTFRVEDTTTKAMSEFGKKNKFNWSGYFKECIKQKLQEGVKNDNKK